MKELNRHNIAAEFRAIQQEICLGLEQLDGKSVFANDEWLRPGGGGGLTRVISDGNVIEKGGVNFSEVFGDIPAPLKKEFGEQTNSFYATGVSIVLHSVNPFVPIMHMNIRYFETDGGHRWFGGGIDLTPHYVIEPLAKQFHLRMKEVCDNHHDEYYPRFKAWADDYFFIKHRNETRGVGGIFFDHLIPVQGQTWNDLFAFVCEVGRNFVAAYTEQAQPNRDRTYDEKNKRWQLIRRGRYVEFNLVYDRGTRFGLETGGRIESILMSLPKDASWLYNFQPEKNSPEEQSLSYFKKGIDWV